MPLTADRSLPVVPEDWTVWSFSDAHGLPEALLSALGEAGLVDAAGRWSAPPRTALIGCGDYVDRGPGVRELVRLLRRLEDEAGAAGGLGIFARGNHEEMLLRVRAGRLEWLATWLRYGGEATLRSYGWGEGARREVVRRDPRPALDAIEDADPGVFAWLATLPQAVRWRDVLFVHGGLAPDHGLEDLGTLTDEHLWIRDAFTRLPWDAPELERYRRAGVDRVVFGHTPQPGGATVHHDGHSLCIDTNAVGDPELPSGTGGLLTLVSPPPDGTLTAARIVAIPTRIRADPPGAPAA